MNPELRELYQEVILDHNRRPRNFRDMGEANRKALGANPLCGDKVRVFVLLAEGIVKDVSFQGSGCAISTASASLMTEAVIGKTQAEAEQMFHRFHEMLTKDREPSEEEGSLGKLEVFRGVKEFPVRVKCATLAWHTLHAALQQSPETITTE